ncbi:MAG: exo-alpha-sialidase [Planctomycetes bacterium]|nr:exo-alpha-sialidase [Planctomycetota bacterium]
MRVVASGYVYDAREGPCHQRSCARTTVTLLQDGTLLAAFRRGSERESLDGHECLFASTDLGHTWKLRFDGHGKGDWDGIPGEVKGLSIAETRPGEITGTGFWVDRSNPALPFIHPRTQGLLPMRIYHVRSTDGGYTWGPRQRMETDPHKACSPASAVLLLAGGVWGQPYENWKEYEDESPGWPAASLRLSSDQGLTWPVFATVARHPGNALYYWDQRLAAHPQTGQLVAMFWTHNPVARVDSDIHIAWGTPDGLSWTTPIPTGLPGQHCQPIALGGNLLAAAYTHRRDPPGIRVALSTDFGRTWNRSQEVVVYDSTAGAESGARGPRAQADLWNDMIAWRFGHARGSLLPTGEVFVIFYAGDDLLKSARWARVAIEAG